MACQAEANRSALIESTEDWAWSVDLDFRLTAFNQKFRDYFETAYNILPAAGMLPESVLPAERAGLMPPLYQCALTTGFFRIEFPLADDRIVALSFTPMFLGGKATGVSAFGKDITERKAAEKSLQEAENRYRNIFDGASEGMFQTTFEGQSILANRAPARMLGYRSPEELAATVCDSAHNVWAEPNERAEFIRQLDEQGAILGFECQFRRKGRTTIWVSLNCRKVIGADGKTMMTEGFIEDITERKRAAQSLAESEARFRSLFDENGSVMLLIEPSGGTIVDANRAASAYYGYAREQLIGMPIGQINTLPPEETAVEWKRALCEERNYFNFKHRLASGEERDVEVYSSPVNVGGRPLLFSVIHDVSKRRETEVQLRESEERYRTTFEQAAIGIVHASFDGTYLRCNARFAEIIGYPQEEILGLSFRQITVPDDLARSEEVRRQIESGASRDVTFEKRYRRKDGKLTWVKVTVTTLYDADSCPLHNVAFVEDINDRKVAEERLSAAMESLLTSEEHYRTIFQTSSDAIMVSHLWNGKLVDVNNAFVKLTGYEREEVIGRTSLELNLWADSKDREAMAACLLETTGIRDMKVQMSRKDGEKRWISVSASLLEVEGIECILSVERDITESIAAEQRLAAAQQAQRASEARYAVAFQTSSDAININRLSDGMYLDCNQTFLDIMGYEREEVVGRTSQELHIWANPSDRLRLVDILQENSHCQGLELQFRKKDGEVFWGQMSASVMDVDGVPCVLSISRDISSAKKAEQEIRDLAYFDRLTHLPNRFLLHDRLEKASPSGNRCNSKRALLLINLDNFKALNHTLGQDAGDLLLQEVARRLTACVPNTDMVARLASDEFVVVLEGLNADPLDASRQSDYVGEKIVASLGQPYLLGDHTYRSSASIGIVVFENVPKNIKRLLQQADIAMRQAKEDGRNGMHFFTPALQFAINARAAMEGDIRHAIGANQFQLYYQPQVHRGALTGVEALIRWNHPKRGIISPDEFIPLAEETGLILPLGNWVLEAACTQIAAWAGRKEKACINVSVNVSVRQFRQQNFVEQVLAALDRTGANPNNLWLEITESMLLEHIEDAIVKIAQLKSHGLRVALDDFGTGYASLSYLKDLKLDQIKIDRAFIRDLESNPKSGAIAQTIISLCRVMGYSVIAEGVETPEQRDLLDGYGCDTFQGYLYSRPLPLQEFEAWHARFAAD